MTLKQRQEIWLTRQKQAERYSRSVRTIERWGLNPEIDLPPEIEVNGRFMRALSKLERWERSRVVKR